MLLLIIVIVLVETFKSVLCRCYVGIDFQIQTI